MLSPLPAVAACNCRNLRLQRPPRAGAGVSGVRSPRGEGVEPLKRARRVVACWRSLEAMGEGDLRVLMGGGRWTMSGGRRMTGDG